MTINERTMTAGDTNAASGAFLQNIIERLQVEMQEEFDAAISEPGTDAETWVVDRLTAATKPFIPRHRLAGIEALVDSLASPVHEALTEQHLANQ